MHWGGRSVESNSWMSVVVMTETSVLMGTENLMYSVVVWEVECACGGICVEMGCQSSGRVVGFGIGHCHGRGGHPKNVRIVY
jgi:hypothetical protein